MVNINFSKLKKPFIIVEIGINHGGNLKKAFELIDAAKNNGADAVKFQTYITEKRVNDKKNKIYKILKKSELSFDYFIKINNYCKKNKITFFSTPFDIESVDFLESINVPFYKIASFDISNYQLINRIIKTKKPTIASTGMAKIDEIKKIFLAFKNKKIQLCLLHCVSSYPNNDEGSYLSNIQFLKNKFKCTIGISDHTDDIKIPIYGVLLGAEVVEKHFRIDKNYRCVDEKVSITAKQLHKMRYEIDKLSKILNKPKFGIRPEERNIKIFKRNRIF